MLTNEERVKSFAHRGLKSLLNYENIVEYTGRIPEAIKDKSMVGVYSNTEDDRVFVLTTGLYLAVLDRFVEYKNMSEINTNQDAVGKENTDTIIISLSDDETIPVRILGMELLDISDVELETREVWQFYRFLKHVYGR